MEQFYATIDQVTEALMSVPEIEDMVITVEICGKLDKIVSENQPPDDEIRYLKVLSKSSKVSNVKEYARDMLDSYNEAGDFSKVKSFPRLQAEKRRRSIEIKAFDGCYFRNQDVFNRYRGLQKLATGEVRFSTEYMNEISSEINETLTEIAEKEDCMEIAKLAQAMKKAYEKTGDVIVKDKELVNPASPNGFIGYRFSPRY
jgi:hypothetical protein